MSEDPLSVFYTWLADATNRGHPEPTAMALATVDAAGQPAVRMVLLKHADPRGFVFYTNTESQKGDHLAHHPVAELCFWWEPPGHQVRVHGRVQPVTDDEANAYFASRPYQSRIGAWASQQSRPLDSQSELLRAVAAEALRHPLHVPRPPHWHGYRVVPDWIELWSAAKFRLHDRVRYTRNADGTGWTPQRLFP